MFCPTCGKQNPSEATYCMSCGNPIQAPAKRVVIQHVPGSAQSKGELVTCGKCGGTGKDYTISLMGATCRVCGGVGKVRV